jgi:hypothetical protein
LQGGRDAPELGRIGAVDPRVTQRLDLRLVQPQPKRSFRSQSLLIRAHSGRPHERHRFSSSLSDLSKNRDFSEYYVHGSPEFIV